VGVIGDWLRASLPLLELVASKTPNTIDDLIVAQLKILLGAAASMPAEEFRAKFAAPAE
jgi:hypothetical protein